MQLESDQLKSDHQSEKDILTKEHKKVVNQI